MKNMTESKYRQLVEEYSDMVTRLCVVHTGNFSDAEDCYQNVFFKLFKQAYPDANIVAIDYDPGATKVNQENRIKLMLANAVMD